MRLNNFLNYLKKINIQSIDQIKISTIENFVTWRKMNGVSDRTCNNDVTALKAIFNIAIRLDLADKNPCREIKITYNSKRPFYWSRDEIRRIFHAATPLYRDIFQLLYYTGLRKGELESLRWENIDFKNKMIVIDKPAPGRTDSKMKPRRIPLHKNAILILKRLSLQSENSLVLPSKFGKKYSHNTWNTVLQRVKKKARIKEGNIHTFRHTFASHLIEKGVDIYLVSKWLGHSSIKMTEIYAHLKPENYGELINKNLI